MTFFNKREDVIDLVLTRRGREKLALGQLNPVYYEFCDDEIIYDRAYAAGVPGEEPQNEIVGRIKTTPKLKNQNGWWETVNTPSKSKKLQPLFKVLGRSSEFDQYKPAWNLQVHESVMSGTHDALGDSSISFTPLEYAEGNVQAFSQEKIPQLNFICDYSVTYVNKTETPETHELWLHKSSDDIFIELKEENTEDTLDNFTLEVYKYDYNDKGIIEELKPIHFSDEEYGNEFVEYFFNVTTDKDAEKSLEIKYIDEEPEKTFEADPCKVGCKPSEQEKIEKLKKEIKKLNSALAIASGAKTGIPCSTSAQCKKYGYDNCKNGFCADRTPSVNIEDKPGYHAPCKSDDDCEKWGKDYGSGNIVNSFPACKDSKCSQGLTKKESAQHGHPCKVPEDCAGQLTCIDESGTGAGKKCTAMACFVAGTKIKLADGTDKAIENIAESDMVTSVDLTTMQLVEKNVLGLIEVVHNDIVHLTFAHAENMNTFDHPYYRVDGKLASYRPDLTKLKYGLDTEQMNIGDAYYFLNEKGEFTETQLLSIQEKVGDQPTYTLMVEDTHNFFASGLLVDDERITIK